MNDTFSNPDNPTANSAYTWNDKEAGTIKDITSPSVMGYENWQGNKSEWMEKAYYCHKSVDYKYTFELPDGSTRTIPSVRVSGSYLYPISVIHGRYMDTICAREGASSSSHYHDATYQQASTARVVARSSLNAYASGGVSCASSHSDSASVLAYYGSRLAFRGKIKWASSVNAFKAISV